eukprot:1180497-Prorocentrum_minimum.AAC.4
MKAQRRKSGIPDQLPGFLNRLWQDQEGDEDVSHSEQASAEEERDDGGEQQQQPQQLSGDAEITTHWPVVYQPCKCRLRVSLHKSTCIDADTYTTTQTRYYHTKPYFLRPVLVLCVMTGESDI